jgi:Domain of unknown function (DUF427)/Major Facilitator Superfamily
MKTKSIKLPGPNHSITIEPNPARVTVSVAGHFIADTQNALTLREASYAPVQYIPQKDVDMTLLKRTDRQTYCPYKGDCAYYSITWRRAVSECGVDLQSTVCSRCRDQGSRCFLPRSCRCNRVSRAIYPSIYVRRWRQSMSVVRTLGRHASFWVAAAVVAHTLWTSAAPSMTYPLYASEWSLTHTATAAIFAVFPIVVVAVLIFSGDISDYMGRRATILIGLSSSLLGTALFAIAPSVLWVFVGRAFIGLGVGLCAGPAAAALLEFSAAGQETRASSINTLAQAVGIVLATIVGGALIQCAPYPTHLNFWVLLVVLAILFAFAWFLPRTDSNKAPGRWQPKLPSIPRGIRKIFAASAIAATSAKRSCFGATSSMPSASSCSTPRSPRFSTSTRLRRRRRGIDCCLSSRAKMF